MIIAVALGIVLFLCLYLGFKTGLRLGMQTARGKIPEVNPVTIIKEAHDKREIEKENKELNSEIEEIMSYTGDIKKR